MGQEDFRLGQKRVLSVESAFPGSLLGSHGGMVPVLMRKPGCFWPLLKAAV
jgi:hypothetical protein